MAQEQDEQEPSVSPPRVVGAVAAIRAALAVLEERVARLEVAAEPADPAQQPAE